MNARELQMPPAIQEQPLWYACHTRSRHEKKVAMLLEQRGVQSYLPLLVTVRKWNKRNVTVLLPAYPSYVFVRFALRDLRSVQSTFGVASIVGVNGTPSPIRDSDILQVRLVIARAAGAGVSPQLEPVQEGEPVMIMAGPFSGIRGVAIQIRGRQRVLVTIPAIAQGLSIEVERRNLKRVGADALRMAPRAAPRKLIQA